MRYIKLTSVAAATALTAGTLLAVAQEAGAYTPKWEPDPQSVGVIAFYDASGSKITSGNIDDKPFAAYAVGSKTVHTGDDHAVMRMAQPNPQAGTGDWNVDDVSAFTAYPLTSGPDDIQTLSQTHPVSTGADTDLSISDFIGEFPNTGPSGAGCAYSPGDPSGCTNAAYQNIYQIRLVTASGSTQSTQYDVADIVVSGNTWTQLAPSSSTLATTAPKSVKYGATAKVFATLKDAHSGKGLAGQQVSLYRRANAHRSWAKVKSLKTSSNGTVSVSLPMTANAQFEYRFAGTTWHKAVTGNIVSVSVTQIVAIHTTASKIRHGHTVKIWGTVRPSGAGQQVMLQQASGRNWKTVAKAKLKKQRLPNGKTAVGYVFSRKLPSKGTYEFRVHKNATSTLAAGTSPTVTVKAT